MRRASRFELLGKGEWLEKMAFALHIMSNRCQDRFRQQNVDELNIQRLFFPLFLLNHQKLCSRAYKKHIKIDNSVIFWFVRFCPFLPILSIFAHFATQKILSSNVNDNFDLQVLEISLKIFTQLNTSFKEHRANEVIMVVAPNVDRMFYEFDVLYQRIFCKMDKNGQNPFLPIFPEFCSFLSVFAHICPFLTIFAHFAPNFIIQD